MAAAAGKSAHAAWAAAASTARGARRQLAATTRFGDGSGTAGDQALDLAAALRTLLNGRVGHLLALFEAMSTFVTVIFVGWH